MSVFLWYFLVRLISLLGCSDHSEEHGVELQDAHQFPDSEIFCPVRVVTCLVYCSHSRRNLERYVAFLEWIRSVPDWTRLKFLDESHFVTRKMSNCKVWGVTSERRYTRDRSLHGPNFSVTLMINLADAARPLFFDFRAESNDQLNFLEVAIHAIEQGMLVDGDFLIVDNAAVHHGEATADMLHDLLTTFGVQLVFLPAYSPELNPCELVFAQAKGTVRNCGEIERDTHIYNLVLDAFVGIEYETLLNYYAHCIFPDNILPDCAF